jgi:hypothetical protein
MHNSENIFKLRPSNKNYAIGSTWGRYEIYTGFELEILNARYQLEYQAVDGGHYQN